MSVTIYHNPDCGTSRNVLALLDAAGAAPRVIEYLKHPPPRSVLMDLAQRSGFGLRGLLREKGTPFADLGLSNAALGDDARLEAIAAHPILINRPIVVTDEGVKLCRPSDVVLDLIDAPRMRLDKEEGAPFLKDTAIPGSDDGLTAALGENHLLTDDLAAPGRTFFRYAMTDGTPAGYGGFELYGEEVFLRSIAVPQALRHHRIGRNLVPLLLYRAYEQGARRAWLLTQTAAPFFAKIGFQPVARDAAPAAIRATRQAQGLCPASATLLTRRIAF